MKFPLGLNDLLANHKNTEMSLRHDKAPYIIIEDKTEIERLNVDLKINEFAPGFTAFATDGGNELYVYDDTGSIFIMPMIGMSAKDAWKIADGWDEFNNIIQGSAQQVDSAEAATNG